MEDGSHWKGKGKKTTDHESSLCRHLHDVVLAVDLGSPGLIHWCHVSNDRDPKHVEEGFPVGQPCCRDREQSIERVVVPLLNWLVHRPWNVAAVSRWTHMSNTLRKLAVGLLADGVLLEALREMKTMWSVKPGLG